MLHSRNRSRSPLRAYVLQLSSLARLCFSLKTPSNFKIRLQSQVSHLSQSLSTSEEDIASKYTESTYSVFAGDREYFTDNCETGLFRSMSFKASGARVVFTNFSRISPRRSSFGSEVIMLRTFVSNCLAFSKTPDTSEIDQR